MSNSRSQTEIPSDARLTASSRYLKVEDLSESDDITEQNQINATGLYGFNPKCQQVERQRLKVGKNAGVMALAKHHVLLLVVTAMDGVRLYKCIIVLL